MRTDVVHTWDSLSTLRIDVVHSVDFLRISLL